ncbi:MAG: TlpA family protein disulfide reductase [Candidatus Thiodiazotropha taylori]|nr:TlpA family protein disulfide reductase [Candidatus Thiodiazotropha taylori]MCW4327585.1 TlpA family protein disulfide reductase [Candidatus Thiodiazotropha taylori]
MICLKAYCARLVLLGLALIMGPVAAEPQAPQACQSQAFASGQFRAYADPKPVSKNAFYNNQGEKIPLNSLPGPRALLVNFWTTWCTPCREEMPSMDRLQARISQDRLMILPLVRDGKGISEASRFYRTHDIIHLPVAADRFGKISYDHRVGALPQTLFVDQQGMVKGMLIGAVDWESEPVLQLLNSCLNLSLNETTSP